VSSLLALTKKFSGCEHSHSQGLYKERGRKREREKEREKEREREICRILLAGEHALSKVHATKAFMSTCTGTSFS
jgi:hypothetical protein